MSLNFLRDSSNIVLLAPNNSIVLVKDDLDLLKLVDGVPLLDNSRVSRFGRANLLNTLVFVVGVIHFVVPNGFHVQKTSLRRERQSRRGDLFDDGVI